MKKLLLLLLTLLALACTSVTKQRQRRCPCGELAAETAFQMAHDAMLVVADEHFPELEIPELVLRSRYFYPGVASAGLKSEGVVVITFDRMFLEQAAVQLGPGAPVWVFAHEIAHGSDLVEGRYLGISDHEMELRADAAAGCAVALAGCQLSSVIALLKKFNGGGTGKTHPDSFERIEAAQRGYDRCATP